MMYTRQTYYNWAAAVLMAVPVIICDTAAADSISFVSASSQYLRAKSKGAYHPINIMDEDPATNWCEGAEGDGEGEEVVISFKKKQKVDRIVINPAATTGRLVREVQISDGTNFVRIKLASGDTVATVDEKLKKPLRGKQYHISILTVGGPNKATKKLRDNVACVADVILYHRDNAFGGKIPPSKLRFDERRDRILGDWLGGPLGAPEKFLTFCLDGTWQWRFEPLMGGKTQDMNGEYRFRGNRLLMRKGETGRWSDMRLSFRDVKVSPDEMGAPLGDYQTLGLGTKLGKKLGGTYNNAQF